LGADDTLSENVLGEVFDQSRQVDVIYGNVHMIEKNGHAQVYGCAFDRQRILQENICHQAMFFRKSLFDKFGAFSLRYPVWADWEFNLRWMLSLTTKSEFIDLTIANYSRNGVSSRKDDPAFIRDKDVLVLRHGRHSLIGKQQFAQFERQIIEHGHVYTSMNFLTVRLKYLFFLLTGHLH
jgi:hypothetical protein